MPRIVHFEITADNPDRAGKFYSQVFGWEIKKWEGPMDYWMIMTGDQSKPGINGGMLKRTEQGGTNCNTIDVPSADEFIRKITAAGGTIVLPKMAVPGVGWLAYFKDTEGNVSGIMQEDKNAN